MYWLVRCCNIFYKIILNYKWDVTHFMKAYPTLFRICVFSLRHFNSYQNTKFRAPEIKLNCNVHLGKSTHIRCCSLLLRNILQQIFTQVKSNTELYLWAAVMSTELHHDQRSYSLVLPALTLDTPGQVAGQLKAKMQH
jgi:hypothetical protein